MEKTIEIRRYWVWYKGKKLGSIVNFLDDRFSLRNSYKFKYRINIVEGGDFTFRAENDDFNIDDFYYLYENTRYIGLICKDEFNKLFFEPEEDKKYNITVKKVRR